MKILIVHNYYASRGGEDAMVDNQIKLLSEAGHQIYLLSEDNKHIENYKFNKKINVVINSFKPNNMKNKLIEVIEEFKPEVAHIHNIYPQFNSSIYSILNKNNIEVFQTLHNYRFICPNGLLFNNGNICEKCIGKNIKLNCITDKCFRDSYFESTWYSALVSLKKIKKSQIHIKKFIALNEFMKSKMVQDGFSENQISIIPNFTDSKKQIDVEKKYFLFIGRLSEEKGIKDFLELAKIFNNQEFMIVGEGPYKEQIIKYIEDNKINNLTLLGYLQGEEKDNVIRSAKAIIVPSTWYENFPTVILEAAALKTISIARKIGGMQFMIQNNIDGYLFENLEELVTIVNNINEEKIVELSNNAYINHSEYFSEKSYYKNIMSLYNN